MDVLFGSLPLIIIFGIIVLSFFGLWFTVKQQTAVIVERLGRFHSVRNSGFHLKIPFVDQISGRISLKIQQLDVVVETKTKDDVF